MADDTLKLYDALADWWPLLSAPSEYAAEAVFYAQTLVAACAGPACTLLELGSGGGNNASHMKAHFEEVVLVDRAPGMLAVSRALNPTCAHVEGDMRDVRLGRTFDCVFVHDAVCYMTTEADLERAIATAFAHCRPGGAALFAPDFVRERFAPATAHGGHDDGVRGLRYLEWSFDPDPSDSTYLVDHAYLLREADGTTRVLHDRHVEGLFSRADWLRLLSTAGFSARAVPMDVEDTPLGHEVFVCHRPSR